MADNETWPISQRSLGTAHVLRAEATWQRVRFDAVQVLIRDASYTERLLATQRAETARGWQKAATPARHEKPMALRKPIAFFFITSK
jgi:hypothetical protein